MSKEVKYCYHCCAYHPSQEMRQIASKSGKRWRCLRSIEASRNSPEARAAFGRKTSAVNSANAKIYALRSAS